MNSEQHITLPSSAKQLIEILEQAGFEAWVVGGFVRDAILKRPVHDLDLATNATWKQVQATCEGHGLKTLETGIAHGTLSVLLPCNPRANPHAKSPKQADAIIEVTTYRTEGTYSDARHPDTIEFVNTIEEDLARRDFTMNAIAWHPTRGLVDPFGGMADLQAGIIRTVGKAQERFAEDALRILRAVRFASELGFSIEADTLEGANAQANRLHMVTTERIVSELNRLLCGPHVLRALLDFPHVIDTTLPELTPLRGFDQKSPYHIYDVMEHTAYVVEATPPDALLRWAALLHDVGKPAAFSVGANGQGHFFGHAQISADITHEIMRRLTMPKRFAADVEMLVRFHDTHIEAQPRLVKRLLRKLNERPDLLHLLCQLQVADAAAHAPGFQERGKLARDVDACLERIVAHNEAFSLKDLQITGSDLIQLGIEPGPRVGELLNAALNAVIGEEIPNEHNAILAFIKSCC